jgi:hypothetical protein
MLAFGVIFGLGVLALLAARWMDIECVNPRQPGPPPVAVTPARHLRLLAAFR